MGNGSDYATTAAGAVTTISSLAGYLKLRDSKKNGAAAGGGGGIGGLLNGGGVGDAVTDEKIKYAKTTLLVSGIGGLVTTGCGLMKLFGSGSKHYSIKNEEKHPNQQQPNFADLN